MAKYEVEYALFIKCMIEAGSEKEAKDRAYSMDEEEIERTGTQKEGYCVWNEPRKIE